MNNRWWRNEFKVGLMTIVALVLLSVMLIRASNWKFNRGAQELRVRFDYVGGLLESAPVHMYGVEIGKVASIELAGDGVEVIARLDKAISIRDEYNILIDTLGIVGEKYIEITNGPASSPETSDDPLRGTSPISVGRVLNQADEIIGKTLITVESVQKFIDTNEEQVSEGLTELRDFILEAKGILKETMGDVDALLERADKLAERTEADVSQTVANLKTFTEELNEDRAEISSHVRSITNDVDQIVTRTAPAIEKSLANLQTVSGELPAAAERIEQHINKLSKSASQLMARFDDIVDSSDVKLQKGLEDFGKSAAVLSETVDRIDKLVAKIEGGQGTVGRLITDESGYQKISDTMTAGRNAAEDISSITNSLERKIRFLDTIGMQKRYELRYNDPSNSLQNQFTLSSSHSSRFFYLAGLDIREGDLTYNLQAGRSFGGLTARAGSIRSKAGIGLDYWTFSRRLGISVEGIDLTDKTPELDLNVAVRLFGGWHFILGAEDIAGSEVGFNLGFRTEMGQ